MLLPAQSAEVACKNAEKIPVWAIRATSIHYANSGGSCIVPKKVELLIRSFEPFWISRVFHFSLLTFGEVEHLPGPLETSDETYTLSKFDISGSNETMQNALASIV